jgi:peptide/nickel transport system permease protein
VKTILRNLRQLRKYPSAVVGLGIIAGLIVLSIVTVIAIPYSEAVRLWRGGEEVWGESPKNAWPIWYDLVTGKRQPRTIVLNPDSEGVTKEVSTKDGVTDVSYRFTFDLDADDFPPEMTLFLESDHADKQPFVAMTWETPDGREIRIGEMSPSKSDSFRFFQDRSLERRLNRQFDGDVTVAQGLFGDPAEDGQKPLKGTYALNVEGVLFEEGTDLQTKLVMYGAVHGIAGTDHQRRDLMVALLWGTPIAISFGLIAAAGTTITTMTIAAIGVWYGGLLDSTIQRVTEVNMILPVLPILIMIGTFYSREIWVMLGAIILLSIFGAGIKSYRAIFIQVRTSGFIEAAQAYGAPNRRIVFRYLVPRVLPMVIPSLVILVPAFVFLEASLAVLGLGDPVLPTWGKVIQNANAEGALFKGYYYWILEPAALLMLAGLAFAMVGFALDRVFNPRLREL